jgi:glucuronate isomerase
MTAFIHDDFLLPTPLARRLYREVAAPLPVVDYHCHLDPADLAADRQFENLAQLWINGDPYKHRAMRIAGVAEELITGPAADRARFDVWAATAPQTLGNPLHHWTALELKRYFDLDEPLSPASADRIWHAANARLREPGFAARGLLAQRGVECVCTSDRLLDDLAPHAALAQSGFKVRVLPSLRADDLLGVDSPDYAAWLGRLATATGSTCDDYDGFRVAVATRLDAFDRLGCRLADHGLDDFVYQRGDDGETAALWRRRAAGEALSGPESVRLRSGLLRFLGAEYGRRRWVLQLHLGAQRHTSTRLRRLAGPAGGYAGIGRPVDLPSVCGLLDDLEQTGRLPRVILYPLNPADFPALAVLSGSFVEAGVPGKVQLGPAWWFNDHAAGMRAQLEATANYGLLSAFVGMTTDSRSLLSMTRHEYFRRVLCGWLGDQAAAGALPDDFGALCALVRALCHGNAHRMLRLEEFPP